MMSSLASKHIPRIPCEHHSEDRITDSKTDEIYCKNCNVVLGFDHTQEVSSESICSLYHEVEMGSKPVPLDIAKRTHEHRSIASYFSNACDKLGFRSYAYRNAWVLFNKLYRNSDFSKAEIACFALFETCQRFSVPKSDLEIQDAVQMAFSVKRVPTMLRVYSIIKIRAKELGIVCEEDNSEYYLNLHLAQIQPRFGKLTFSLIQKRARETFHKMKGNNESRAKKALSVALKGCIVP